MTRIIAHFVVKNEAERFLAAALASASEICDDVFVFDDQSTDDTVKIAKKYGAVCVRSSPTSFMDNESSFRQEAWDAMATTLNPVAGKDWVMCLDADEVLASQRDNEREGLGDLIRRAEAEGADAVDMRIDEIFKVDRGQLFRRVDGFWGDIHGTRLVRFGPGAFSSKKMGGGSTPRPERPPVDARKAEPGILHFGYVLEKDRMDKFERYSSTKRNGHASSHVRSIMAEPILVPIGRPYWVEL